tara:strand:+ start:979 stop:1887 length:909 start_codon:yes stop_codon:yes gene_type:complete
MKIICPFHQENDLTGCGKCSQCGFTVEQNDPIDLKYFVNNTRNSELEYESEYSNYAKIDLEEGIYSYEFQHHIAMQTCNYIYGISKKDIAELGVGKGELIKELVSRNPKSITLLDIAEPFLKEIKTFFNKNIKNHDSCKTVLGNVEYMPFENSFDTIIATDILEHVMNLGNALKRISASMRTGGHFFCRVPLDEALGQYSIYNGCDFRFAHLRSFNKEILESQFNEVGLKIEKLYKYCFLKERFVKGASDRLKHILKKVYKILKIYGMSDIDFNILLNKKTFFWLKSFHQPLEVLVVAKKIK